MRRREVMIGQMSREPATRARLPGHGEVTITSLNDPSE